MTTFREFLSYRNVINEDAKTEWEKIENDPKNKALEVFKKSKGFSPAGIPVNATDEQKKGYVEEINKSIVRDKGRDSEQFSDWDEVVDAWEKYTDDKKTHDVDVNDVADADDKMEYLKTALREGGRIKNVFNLPSDVAKNIADAFSKADKSNDGNNKVDKEEFINAIKFIKKQAAFKSREINATNIASLLYFVYLTRAIKSSTTGRNGPIKSGYLISVNNKKDFNIDSIENLNENYLSHFSKLNFDSKVLSIFAKPNDAAAFIKNTNQETDEEQFEKIRNSFFDNDTDEPKTSSKGKKSKKEEEETEEQKQAAKEVEEVKAAKDETDEKIEKLKQEKEEMEKTPETGREQAVSKKKFYIFDIDTPEPSDDIEEWFKNMREPKYAGGVMGMIDKIRKELEGYEPKSNKDDLSEAIAKVFKKSGIILEDYNKTSEKINKLIKNAVGKVEDYLDGAYHKAKSLQEKIKSNSSYMATVELRRQFKQLFIDLGYVLSQEVRALVRATDLKMDSLKNAKRREGFDSYKTTEQRGQEELDARNVIKIINGVNVSRDDQHIARFMLINLLNSESSSEKILEYLNSKSFGDNKYVYSGTSGLIYALSKNDVEIDDKLGNGIMLYNFKRVKARVYKNPADLIETAVGIKVSSLTPDVLKTAKKEAAARAGEAEKYLSGANTISTIVSKLGGIALNEGIMDFIRTKDTTKNSDFKELNTTLANKEQKQGVADVIGAIQNCSYEINLDREFQPQGNGPEDIALRQIFKGFCLIDVGGKRYVSTYDAIKKGIASANAKRHQESEAAKKATDMTHIVEPELNKSDQSNMSVVTSGNADSTYGDGYGYNKKTDAIKKKLNSTTYTYMPNSKMRIVRRTFD